MTTVPSQWPKSGTCKIAFIAEAPSDEEELAGIPLVGPAGRLFDKLLKIAMIDRSECFVTNVFDFKLEDNQVRSICGTTAEAKEWRKAGYMLPPIKDGSTNLWVKPEFQCQLNRLYDEIKRVQPTVIVPLGGTALWAVKGVSNIMAHRGTVSHAGMFRTNYKVVPTVHPSFLFHSWKLFATVVADLMKADREGEFPEIRLPERELWVDPDLGDLVEFKRKYLDQSKLIAIDIETIPKWRHITSVAFAGDAYHSISIPLVDNRQLDNSYWRSPGEELEAIEFIRDICETDIPKILQNGPYDIQWLWWKWGISVRNYLHDTRLMHHALYPELPKALGFLGSRYAELGPWKVMRQKKEGKVDD